MSSKELFDPQNYKKKGFDDRIVRYEQIYGIEDKYYQILMSIIDPQEGEVIFEGCAGYADVSKHIIGATKNFKNKPEIYLQDESIVQIKRAHEELQLSGNKNHMLLGDIRATGMPQNKFDKAVIKMGIHELPKKEQLKIFTEMYRILKPEGKFVICEWLLNENTQKIFQDVIRKKDELAGFDAMVQNRYFPKYEELQKLFKDVGFKNVKDEYSIQHTFNPKRLNEELISKNRLQILNEKGILSLEDENKLNFLGQERINILVQYMRERISEKEKVKVGCKETSNNIEIKIDEIIMSGKK